MGKLKVDEIKERHQLQIENRRLVAAVKDLIGGYEAKLPELWRKFDGYDEGSEGQYRISARIDEIKGFIDALRAIVKEG